MYRKCVDKCSVLGSLERCKSKPSYFVMGFLCVIIILMALTSGSTYTPQKLIKKSHRLSVRLNNNAMSSSLVAIMLSTALLSPIPANAIPGIISADPCIIGEGVGCDAAAEGNSYIIQLQKQSKER